MSALLSRLPNFRLPMFRIGVALLTLALIGCSASFRASDSKSRDDASSGYDAAERLVDAPAPEAAGGEPAAPAAALSGAADRPGAAADAGASSGDAAGAPRDIGGGAEMAAPELSAPRAPAMGGGSGEVGGGAGPASPGRMTRLPATGRAAMEMAVETAAAGVLTSGSFSDVLNFEAYQRFAERFVGKGGAAADHPESLIGYPEPGFAVGPPLRVRVVDAAGLGVPDARVVVTSAGGAEPLVETITRASGDVVLLTGLEADAAAESFTVTVHPPDGSPVIARSVAPSREVEEIVLAEVEGLLPKQLDFAFVIDATGSMSDEIEYLKLEVDGIVGEVRSAFPDVDQRHALIVYRDEGDEYVTRVFDFTADIADFSHSLSAQSADGGGDEPEAMQDALADAVVLSWRTQGTARVLFLLADAPPHVEHAGDTMDQVRKLRSAGVAIYPVAASGVAEAAEIVMRTAALLSASQYVFLTDDSGAGNPHAEPHIPCYDVEHLNDTVVRMIATELTGHYIPPKPESVLRSVGHSLDGICGDDRPTPGAGPTGTPEQ